MNEKRDTHTIMLRNSQLGEIEVPEDAVIHFKQGILGYEFLKKFAVAEVVDCSPFLWCIAMDEPEIAFPILDYDLIDPEYQIKLSASDRKDLELGESDQFLTFFIITVDEENEEVSANLKGPLVINKDKNLGAQVIALDEAYVIHYPITHKEKVC